MKSRSLATFPIVLGLLAAYWYVAPYLALMAMKSAAEKQDAEAFNARVDYPRLRENLRIELLAALGGGAKNSNAASDPMQGMGEDLAKAMVMPLIDELVRPEVVMRAMTEGKLQRQRKGTANNAPQEKHQNGMDSIDWRTERSGMNRFVVWVRGKADAENRQVGMIFEQSGFSNWKLTGIQFPAIQ